MAIRVNLSSAIVFLKYVITGNYLGAKHTPKGVRFQRNLCLGVWKFWEPHIDVIFQITNFGKWEYKNGIIKGEIRGKCGNY